MAKIFICDAIISGEELLMYEDMIKFLGGKFLRCANNQFINSCTHVIVITYTGSVKVMGGLASGKWLITKEYVIQSYKNKKWLKEEDFEIPQHDNNARYLRQKSGKLYDEMRCFVECNNSTFTKSLVRVLAAGGATILNRKDIENHANVWFAITSKECLESVQTLVGTSIPIVDLQYIKRTVFNKHNPRNFKKFLLNKDVDQSLTSNRVDQKIIFVKNEYTVGKPSTPTPRILRRIQTQRSITNYFNEDDKSCLKPKRLKFNVDSSTTDEISLIEEIKEEVDSRERSPVLVEVIDTPPQICSSNRSGLAQEHIPTVNVGPEVSHSSSSSNLVENIELLATDVQKQIKKVTLDHVEDTTIITNQNPELSSENLVYKNNLNKLSLARHVIIPLDRPRMTNLVSNLLIDFNTSSAFLNHCHIPIYRYPTVNTTVLDQSDSNYLGSCRDRESRIVSRRVGRFKMNVVEKVSGQDADAEENHVIDLNALEYLKISVQSDVVLDSRAAGALFKHHILNFPLKDVSDKALNIFHSLVSLHPPQDRKMRDYYLSVFQKGIPDKYITHHPAKGWNFISILLNDLVSNSSKAKYDVYKAMDVITQLLELDLVFYNEKPISVTFLLSYRLFWIGKSQAPNIINPAVKELIQMWISSANESSMVLRRVTKLVSLMLELLWKWSDIHDPYELLSWPLPSKFMPLADVLLTKFREQGPDILLKLVEAVEVPWQQLYLTSLAYRAKLDSCDMEFELSSMYLKSKLDDEVRMCNQKENVISDDTFSHETKIQFLCLLIVSCNHTMGIRHCKSELLNQIKESIRKQDIICPFADELQNSEPLRDRERNGGVPKEGNRNMDQKPAATRINFGETDKNDEESEGRSSNNRVLVRNIMKEFSYMSTYTRELNDMKKICSHLANMNFSNAL